MRVLHVIESLEFGGAEMVAIDLANQTALRHTVMMCCVKRIGDLQSRVDTNIRVFCLDKGEGNDLRLPFRLADILRKERIDVLHAHNWGVFLEAAVAGAMAGTSVCLHTVHGPYMDYSARWFSRVKRSLRHFLERWLSSRYTKIVTVSDSIQHYIREEIGIPNRCLVTIHNGISAKPAVLPVRESNSFNCITVGRMAAIKNQQMMLHAFHGGAGPDAHLVMVGDGPERSSLELLARDLGISDRVVFAGFRHDVVELLAGSDVFLMSSNYEGVSIAILEAMRAGLPVVGTRVGGIPETVIDGRTGYLVDAGDTQGMARVLTRLRESPDERRRLGMAGRKYLEDEFSVDKMVARYERLYGGEAA